MAKLLWLAVGLVIFIVHCNGQTVPEDDDPLDNPRQRRVNLCGSTIEAASCTCNGKMDIADCNCLKPINSKVNTFFQF